MLLAAVCTVQWRVTVGAAGKAERVTAVSLAWRTVFPAQSVRRPPTAPPASQAPPCWRAASATPSSPTSRPIWSSSGRTSGEPECTAVTSIWPGVQVRGWRGAATRAGYPLDRGAVDQPQRARHHRAAGGARARVDQCGVRPPARTRLGHAHRNTAHYQLHFCSTLPHLILFHS